MSLLLRQKYVALNNRLNAGAHNVFVPLETPPAIKGWDATASVWRDKNLGPLGGFLLRLVKVLVKLSSQSSLRSLSALTFWFCSLDA